MGHTFKNLLKSIKIGNIEIKNRVAMAPMGIGGMTNLDGGPGSRALDYYIERARGGVGLIITSLFKVENEIDALPQGFMLISPVALAPFTELAETVHALGTKIFVQLTAGFGRVASPRLLRGKPVSASAIPYYWNPALTCKELTVEEVERLAKAFGPISHILAEAGIDGVELHGHEGYLFDQFTTGLWNHRSDRYGGDLPGRLYFPIEVLKEIKKQVGDNFPVQYRFALKHYIKGYNTGALPGEEYVEAGQNIEEGLRMAKILEEAGFDALHVDAGCYDSWYWPHPPGYQKHGCMIDMAEEVKKVVKIPVIAVGRLDIPELAEQVIAEGKADIVAVGRGLLADPFWVKKIEEGQPEQIRPCIGCHEGCMNRLVNDKPLSCAVNPACGRERTYTLQPAKERQNIMVIGGGISGMEAARVAKSRGHKVVLYEKSTQLGGHLIEASMPAFKKDELRLLNWYKNELKNLGVEVHLNQEVTPDLIEDKKPEAVIVSTGSNPIILNVPGITKERIVMTVTDLLLDKKKTGETVVVIGGGRVGCETAIWLAQQGKKVTVVEKLDKLMSTDPPIPRMNRMMLLDLLNFYKVNLLMNTSLLEVKDNEVVVINKPFSKNTLKTDTVVLAVGLIPNQDLYRELQGKIHNLYLIGDSRQARNIMGAIWDAYEVARTI
jgi:2-enoate reductase